MTNTNEQHWVSIDALRVGLFIHLDMGWMSHPFPLGSFKIVSEEQIATLRTLKKQRFRWVPEKSDMPVVVPSAAPEEVPVALVPPSAEELAAQAHRDALAAQRDALAVCEGQFAEASQAVRKTMNMVPMHPVAAREHSEALSRTLVDKMVGASELNIRLLSEAAGDQVSNHAVNVAIMALLMGRGFGLSSEEMIDLGVGAMLHDIGKLDLPDRVRHRDDALSAADAEHYRKHVAFGVAQGARMGLSSVPMQVISQHHEQADGSGFPLKLNIDRMSAAARIVALVDRYDNLCNPHVPSKALTPHEAVSLMFAQGQRQFDTTMLSAFIKMIGVYPPGSTVQLTDDRYAMVVSVNSTRPLKPRVLVHEPGVARDNALIVDLEKLGGLGIRRSLKPAQLPRETYNYLSPRPRMSYFFEPAVETVGEREEACA